jgi:hypothetical protein
MLFILNPKTNSIMNLVYVKFNSPLSWRSGFFKTKDHLVKSTVQLVLLTVIFFSFQQTAAQSITKIRAGAAGTSVTVFSPGNGNSQPWTNFDVSQIQNPDDINASMILQGKKSSDHIGAFDWGFTIGGSGGFPANAFLSGIKVEIKKSTAFGAIVDGDDLQLLLKWGNGGFFENE